MSNPSSSPGPASRSTWHIELRKILEGYFDETELETLCFDLRIDYESLAGDSKTHKVVDLVRTFARTGRIDELIDYCSRVRPNVPWGELRQAAASNPLVVETRPDEPALAPAARPPAEPVQPAPKRLWLAAVLVTVLAVIAGVVVWRVVFVDGGPDGPTVSASPTARSPSPSAGFRIVDVTLRADPGAYEGPCPVTITFSGRISVAGAGGTVTYRFLRSDGASDPVKTLVFESAGSKEIKDTWSLGNAASRRTLTGWKAVQIFDPEERTYDQAPFTIRCT